MNATVIIPTYRRPAKLIRCLQALVLQTDPRYEVVVVWQGDDLDTPAAVNSMDRKPPVLRLAHSPAAGIVFAENIGLLNSTSEIVILVDDDCVPPVDFVEKHLRHYSDSMVGCVGGPVRNWMYEGEPYPVRSQEPIGKITLVGRFIGNTYNHVPGWVTRQVINVDHVAGGNMSIRRKAIGSFCEQLRPYWHFFETEACCQVKTRGYRVVFDFSNIVDHYPTTTDYSRRTTADLQRHVYNVAFNRGFILSSMSHSASRAIRFLYWLLVGGVNEPGAVAAVYSILRGHQPFDEIKTCMKTMRHFLAGWNAGANQRAQYRAAG